MHRLARDLGLGPPASAALRPPVTARRDRGDDPDAARQRPGDQGRATRREAHALADVARLELIRDRAGTLQERYGVTSQPSYVLIGDHGSVELVAGELGTVGLASMVAALITT